MFFKGTIPSCSLRCTTLRRLPCTPLPTSSRTSSTRTRMPCLPASLLLVGTSRPVPASTTFPWAAVSSRLTGPLVALAPRTFMASVTRRGSQAGGKRRRSTLSEMVSALSLSLSLTSRIELLTVDHARWLGQLWHWPCRATALQVAPSEWLSSQKTMLSASLCRVIRWVLILGPRSGCSGC